MKTLICGHSGIMSISRPSLPLAITTMCIAFFCGCESSSGEQAGATSSTDDQTDGDAAANQEEGGAADQTKMVGQEVMAWVPPYGVQTGKEVWNSPELGAADSLTRIGLQFWTLTEASTLEYMNSVTDDDVRWFVEQAHQKDVLALATIMNEGTQLGEPGFHWGLVRTALKDDGVEKVAAALLEIVGKFDLDGIDLDLEAWKQDGPDSTYTRADRELFARLVATLSEQLKPQGKILTAASFAFNGRAIPQPAWWGDWAGAVDSIHAMGYVETFAGGLGRADYQEVQNFALSQGFDARQLLIGVPAWVDAWEGSENNQGVTNLDNLAFLANCLDEKSGVAVWAFDHPAAHIIPETGTAPWSDTGPWQALQAFQTETEQDKSVCAPFLPNRALFDDMSYSGQNRYGGNWLALNDLWDRPESKRDEATAVMTYDSSYDLGFGEGVWGDISRGYREEEDRSLLSATIEVSTLEDGEAWGGLWMEFLPRDCSRFDEIGDECNWHPKGLGEFDASAYDQLHIGLRCDAGATVQLQIETQKDAENAAYSYRQEVDCDGEWADIAIDLSQVDARSQLARLGVVVVSNEAPLSTSFDIAGISFDTEVL
ncbi:MAG: glycosyl hydrolase family 18 protein [Polyangiaceae bacterium]|nr:glycosyl hydrolase family 18 protein [Polyangiaceae bacterium]